MIKETEPGLWPGVMCQCIEVDINASHAHVTSEVDINASHAHVASDVTPGREKAI